MIRLRDKDTGSVIGSISEAQFEFLQEQLEEESRSDTDYYFDGATLEMLEGRGADPQLLRLLQNALGSRPEMEIEWEPT
jgi:hypothetical protein